MPVKERCRIATMPGQVCRNYMTAADVIEIYQLLIGNGIRVHVDGGGGIDALLGEQTRSYADLDIAVPHKDVPHLRNLLRSRSFKEIPRDDSWECNFVLGDELGGELDVHSYTFDAEGNNVFDVPYPVDSLTGTGTIDGYQVDCISAEWMVKFHTGYALDINDYRDVSALCERFGLKLPPEYSEFKKEKIS
jgi:lincosamide nucleotidyltransferase A/C/D/E